MQTRRYLKIRHGGQQGAARRTRPVNRDGRSGTAHWSPAPAESWFDGAPFPAHAPATDRTAVRQPRRWGSPEPAAVRARHRAIIEEITGATGLRRQAHHPAPLPSQSRRHRAAAAGPTLRAAQPAPTWAPGPTAPTRQLPTRQARSPVGARRPRPPGLLPGALALALLLGGGVAAARSDTLDRYTPAQLPDNAQLVAFANSLVEELRSHL